MEAKPRTDKERFGELLRCRDDYVHFIKTYVKIESIETGQWIAFDLWPAQERVLRRIHESRLLVILKARQLGLTWLVLAYLLWLMLFHPIAAVLLFSKREDEAVNLLDERMKGMYDRLPAWMRCEDEFTDRKTLWALSVGSKARAFSTAGGDSYTASVAFLDEFDLHSKAKQREMLNAVKPTIDAGGKLIMMSRPNKTNAQDTPFKETYWSATRGENNYEAVFLPWHARPDRDGAWYEAIVADADTLDDVHTNYPATDAEALAPAQENKRIPAGWVDECYSELAPYRIETIEHVPNEIPPAVVQVYQLPQPGREYRAGVDPAEGNPTSNDSATEVVDRETGEEVAIIRGKVQPSTLARYTNALAGWYNDAPVLVERNNHGHAFILWFEERRNTVALLHGNDNKAGWQSTRPSKALLYDNLADTLKAGDAELHDATTQHQIKSIDGNKLKSLEGHDDSADAYALAQQARAMQAPATGKMTSGSVDFYA